MARRDSRDEVPKLFMRCLIGKSTGEGVERPKLQPARPLSDGDLNGAAQRSGGGFAFSAAICELTVESPQLGLQIALVAALCPREPLACGGSSLVELADHAASPGEKKECVGQMESLPVGTRARHRPHDLINAPSRSLADVQPAPKGLQDDHEVALRKALPYKVGFREELGEAGEILGFGRDDRRVSDDIPKGHQMIEIDGQRKSGRGGLVGPAGSSRYMSFFRELAGSASSVYTTMMFFLGGTFGWLSGVLNDGTLLPIAAMMLMASLTANAISWGLPRRLAPVAQ